MSSDFRTANLEKKILSRIAYLEQLQRSYGEEPTAEHNKVAEALREQHELLAEVQEQVAQPERVKESADMELSVPLPDLPEVAKPSYPVYLPSPTVLERWRVEAKHAHEAFGDQADHPRRVLVLVEALEDLLRIVREENVQLDLLGREETPDLIPTDVQPAFPLQGLD